MEKYEEIEKTITKSYRKEIWRKFVQAIVDFEMISEGDKIAICISGGKDSMLMAKCFQELQRHRKMHFDIEFLVMNPGYNEKNKQKIIDNSKILNIPINMFETDIFERVERIEDHPCYLCARMRRGHLYEKAKELGCNKIALRTSFWWCYRNYFNGNALWSTSSNYDAKSEKYISSTVWSLFAQCII